MRRQVVVISALVWWLAVGGHSTAAVPPGAGAAPVDIAEALRRQAAGQPVFLIQQKAGDIEARTPDGKLLRHLGTSGPRALLDSARDLIWTVSDGRMEVIDLRATSVKPIRIAEKVPLVFTMTIQYSDEEVLETFGDCGAANAVSVIWGAEPEVKVEEGEAPDLVGRNWLVAQRDRSLRPAAKVFELTSSEKRVAMKCQPSRIDKKRCGRAVPFGGPDRELVLVTSRDSGGDCPDVACVLHDPGRKLFAQPPEGSRWGSLASTSPGPCGSYYFDASKHWYLATGLLCPVGGGQCQKFGVARAIGWLDPGPIYPLL